MASARLCARFNDNFIVITKSITCKLCDEKFHNPCVKSKDSTVKVIVSESQNVFWFCHDCVGNLEEKVNISKQMKNMEEQTNKLMEDTRNVLQTITNARLHENNSSYANIVKKAEIPLIIKPKNPKRNSSVTKSDLVQKIKPADISIDVSKVKPARQGSLLIHCDNGESLQKLKDMAVNELSTNYEIEVPKKFNPRVLIVGVKERDFGDSDIFLNNLKSQNFSNIDNLEDIKIVKT